MSVILDNLRALRRGRPPSEPHRDTQIYPKMMQYGQTRTSNVKPAYKPTPRNLRYFATTPYARRAINAVKNSISHLEWEIVAKPNATMSDEIKRQIELTFNCFENPNDDDSFSQLLEMTVEDMMLGAGAIEQQIGGDPSRPLWMWVVDALSIQIYPGWTGAKDEARYVQMLNYGGATGAYEVCSLRNDELLYIRPNPSSATPFGLGPLEVAFNSVSRQLAVASFAGNVSGNSSPAGMLHLGDVSQDHVIAFRQFWKNDVEGQGRMPITGGGEKPPSYLEFHPGGDTALYLKYQDFLKREIAIAFDLSPQNLGIESDINRNTSEVAEDRDIAQTIGPTGRKIAKSFSRETIQGRLGFSQLEFRFKGLDREDEMEEAKVYEAEYKNNAVTPNEYRVRRGRPPMASPWGDLTFADFQIATRAATGTKTIADSERNNFDDPGSPSPPGDRIDTSLPKRDTKTKEK